MAFWEFQLGWVKGIIRPADVSVLRKLSVPLDSVCIRFFQLYIHHVSPMMSPLGPV